jgi:hypothetical protein
VNEGGKEGKRRMKAEKILNEERKLSIIMSKSFLQQLTAIKAGQGIRIPCCYVI